MVVILPVIHYHSLLLTINNHYFVNSCLWLAILCIDDTGMHLQTTIDGHVSYLLTFDHWWSLLKSHCAINKLLFGHHEQFTIFWSLIITINSSVHSQCVAFRYDREDAITPNPPVESWYPIGKQNIWGVLSPFLGNSIINHYEPLSKP